MKKNIYLSILIAFAVTSMTLAQDLDKILDKHFNAIGQKNIISVKSLKTTGTASMMMGGTSPIEIVSKRPNKVLVTIDFQGTLIKQAYDGESAWTINPMMGSSSATTVTGAEADGLKESADMNGQLWKYKEKGHKLELEEPGEVDGKDVFTLKLTKKNGRVDFYHLDQESFFIVLVKSNTVMNGSEVEIETYFSHYEEADGYLTPMKIVQKMGGQIVITLTFEEVVLNAKVDDAVFVKPD